MKKSHHLRLVFVAVGLLAMLLVPTILTPQPAHAQFPGANGLIAYATTRDGNSEIYTMNADGSSQTRLTSSPAEDVHPAWSPDGTQIAFTSTRDGQMEIYVMNADGSGQTRLTNNPATDQFPAWSPDGSQMVFTSTRDGQTELYVMNADGTDQTRLTNSMAFEGNPSWSPDGSKIVYHIDTSADGEVYVINPDGTGETPLTNTAGYNYLASWSPDGSMITFTSTRDGNYEIYVMNADGSGQTRITNDPAWDWNSEWSPEGTQLVFSGRRVGNYEIYLTNADGSGIANLTNNPGTDGDMSWQPMVTAVVTIPSSTEVYPGDTVTVSLDIQNADGLYAMQTSCTADPAILAVQSGEFGSFFDPASRFIAENATGGGTWNGAVSLLSPAAPLFGNGNYAMLTYQAVSPGTATITCTGMLSNQDGTEQAVTFVNTSVTVLPFATVDGVATYQGRTSHAGIDVSATGPVTHSDLTDAGGAYLIDQLEAGTYAVEADAQLYLPSCTAATLAPGDAVTLAAAQLRGGDTNDDDTINIGDATLVAANFRLTVPPADVRADINGDGVVNILDLALLGSNYGRSGCQAW